MRTLKKIAQSTYWTPSRGQIMGNSLKQNYRKLSKTALEPINSPQTQQFYTCQPINRQLVFSHIRI